LLNSPLLRVTRELDYALDILLVLVREPDRPQSGASLTSAAGAPLSMGARIMLTLRRARITLDRSPHRGFRLADDADHTSIASVVEDTRDISRGASTQARRLGRC
jgi:DNA-binding IscR family transcriptional regulator